jgi:hypothetical protein
MIKKMRNQTYTPKWEQEEEEEKMFIRFPTQLDERMWKEKFRDCFALLMTT